MTSKPVLLVVDDDPAVLQALTRDLRRQYADRYRVVRADSGEHALETLRDLRTSNDQVALIMCDQRMPGLKGVDLLELSLEIYPETKRVLITGQADLAETIDAINRAGLDHYLRKPWGVKDELYPVLDELLEDWAADARPPFEGVTLIGHRWSARSHEVKDLLARQHVAFRWLDVDTSAEAHQMLAAAQIAPTPEHLPVVMTNDGAPLEAPDNVALAASMGWQTRPALTFYDLIVVGAGPAGLAAAVYGASEGLNTVLVEQRAPGGQAGQSSRIENYLGFPIGIAGADLARRAARQVRRFGAEIINVRSACSLEARGGARLVGLADGGVLEARSVIIATGCDYRRLDVPGIEQLNGRGVYYGAAQGDAQNVVDREVYLVGAANSAAQAALNLATTARQVTLIVRGDKFTTMSQYLVDRVEEHPKIRLLMHSEVAAVHGTEHVEELTIAINSDASETRVPADFLFVFIGAQPRTEWLGDSVARDAHGFVLTGPDLRASDASPRFPLEREPYLFETTLPGVFAAGDVRSSSMKRVASAVGEGATAVHLVHRYLENS
jgi:thioredoxin reductase (NADPH)